MSKKYLKVAGIINIVLGSLLILSVFGFILGIPLLINGIIFEEYSKMDIEKIKLKKNTILVWSIVLLFLNLITSVLGFIAYEKLNNEENISAESRKLDVLLKFGVFMVCIAGIIFATTSWKILSNNIKTIVLLIFSLFFFILYIISNKFIKIKSTCITYYILGWLFIIFSYISMIYFNIAGITYDALSMSVLFLLLSIFSYITYRKFDSKSFFHISLLSFVVSIFLITFEFLTLGYSLMIVLLISILGNIIFRKNVEFDITLYATSFVSAFAILTSEVTSFERILLTIIIICSLFLKAFIVRKNVYNVLFLIVSYLIVLCNFADMKLTLNMLISMSGSIMAINLLELLFNNKNAFIVSTIISNLILFILYLTQIGETHIYYLNILIALFMIIPSLISRIMKRSSDLCEVIEPIQIALLIEGIRYCLSQYIDVYNSDYLFVEPLILSLISLFKSKELSRNSYYVIIYLLIFTCIDVTNLVSIFVFILSSLMLYIKESLNKSNTHVVLYILTTLITFIGFDVIGEKYDMTFVISFVQIALLVLFALICNHKVLKTITLFLICVPYFNLSTLPNLNENFIFVSDYVIAIYYGLLISSFIKTTKGKRDFLFVFILLLLLSLILSTNITSGILAGVISLVCIYVGFFNKNYDSLYKLGIILGIINIVYKFKYLLDQIPFFVYLLITGLLIIIFVTYKQIKDQK